MSLEFYAIALSMTVVALGFAATPLVIAYRSSNRGFAQLPLLVVVVVIALAILLYGALGRPDIRSQAGSAEGTEKTVRQMPTTAGKQKVESVGSLLAGLEQRVLDAPDNGGDWLLLAKSYEHMGRQADARTAYEKAVALGMADEEFAARLYASTAEPPQGAVEIRGRVNVDSSVADRLQPDDIVFIIARAPGQSMPLAVLKRTAAELPFDFTLSDASSMVQGQGIASAPMVTVSAKVSNSGNALDSASELAAPGRTLAPSGGAFVELTITSGGGS